MITFNATQFDCAGAETDCAKMMVYRSVDSLLRTEIGQKGEDLLRRHFTGFHQRALLQIVDIQTDVIRASQLGCHQFDGPSACETCPGHQVDAATRYATPAALWPIRQAAWCFDQVAQLF